MSLEGQACDIKSLRALTVKNPDWSGLAKDCVAFANAQGGRLLIGIEDGASEPPAGQHVPSELLDQARARIAEKTANVTMAVQLRQSPTTGGEYLELDIQRALVPASTCDGRFYLRVGDASKPLVGAEVQRLLLERSSQPWETMTTLTVPRAQRDPALCEAFIFGIHASDRVKESVKDKGAEELLDHYDLTSGPHLTNLGILCVGRREARSRLGTAPVIQCIRYDAAERKVAKWYWGDHTLSPMQLIDAIWREVPDFHETYELPDGLWRQHIPVYDERIVRELLVNALVHRPYTQQGDIYLNLHPDRLEMLNPGLLPLGVTTQNILHQSVRRNQQLARVFHDLGLMEAEGSGYDLVYDVLLSQGRSLPRVAEGTDCVRVVIEKRIMKPEVINFLSRADQTFQLRQRERIALGLLVQREGMSARELADALELTDTADIGPWLGRLLELGIARQAGRTKGARYFVGPEHLQSFNFQAQTSLARIEPHRLEALVLEDIVRYPGTAIGRIHERIGLEIKRRQVKLALDRLCGKGRVRSEGDRRGRKYWPVEKH